MTLPIGLSVRNFLFTGVLEKLIASGGVRVVAFTAIPEIAEKYRSADDHLIFEPLPRFRRHTTTGAINRMLNLRFQHIHSDPLLTSTKQNRRIVRANRPRQYLLDILMSYPLPKSKTLFKWLNVVHNRPARVPSAVRSLFDRYQPSLLFATNPIAMEEYQFLKYAKLTGTTTVGMIHSWDTLTNGGRMVVPLDYHLVWNSVMKSGLTSLHRIPEEQIRVAGIPQFDLYAEPFPNSRRKEFLLEHGLDPEKQTILFTTTPAALSPDEPEIVRRLLSFLDCDNGRKVQMIVRVHQQDIIQRFASINHPSVIFHVPGAPIANLGDNRVMDGADLRLLRDSIGCCDVVINAASTITIDAAALGKPVVNIDFDLQERSYYRSVRKYYNTVHFKRVVETGASRLAGSFDELETLVRRYLANPELEQQERANLVETLCHKVDGKSAERIAGYLLETLYNNQQRPVGDSVRGN